MAISKNGPLGATSGKIGNLVYYECMGQERVRTVGYNLHPPTTAQLASRAEISVTSRFLKPALEFINTGFAAKAAAELRLTYNLAMSYNKLNALTGVYPNCSIDYEKALLSQGDLQTAQNPSVALTANGLQFSWFTAPDMAWPELSDQVMLLAYFPGSRKVSFALYGPERIQGTAFLALGTPMLDQYMETYISFISADRKQVSDSVYTGSFNKI
ncbi:MAG: hypothetical protein EOO88_00920 [Pedobacter sp.]|nr:MAG: hypothetical protein EOO88_00920 [Pedobacter sp.]